jgi:transcriptional regulator with XRE-family HTH domain
LRGCCPLGTAVLSLPAVELSVYTLGMSARAQFIVFLKRYRELAGLTQDQAASKLQVSTSLYKKIEQDKARPQADFAQRCDALYDTKVGVFVSIHRDLLAEPFPEWFGPRVQHEDAAESIHEWEMRGIPGLLQTEAYARAVFTSYRPYDAPEAIETDVRARLDRQDILAREHPPKLWVVISEGVLRHMVGGPKVMHEQLDHLVSLASSQWVVLQVFPFSAGDAPGANGPAALFEFEDKPTVAYLEGWDTGRVIEDPKSVAGIMTAISMIKSCALSPRDSVQLIGEIRGV